MDAYLANHGSWAELVLNRPDRKNAITGPLGQALTVCLEEASSDAALQVILLRGEGGAFCSGLDLKHFNADPPPDWLPDFQQIWRGAHRAQFDCNKPIIGALEGYAINGGAALAFASKDAVAISETGPDVVRHTSPQADVRTDLDGFRQAVRAAAGFFKRKHTS